MYAMYFFFLIRELPSIESLKNYHPPLISRVFDREGRRAGEFLKERRILVPFSQFPQVLIQAFVSAEDGRFFEHKGLNMKAIFRAFLANLKAGKKVQGGSTITQQVARSLLLSSEKTYTRKMREAVLALRMEKYLSKEEILYLYLNQIYLGHGAYGVGMAAEIYFRKKTEDLNLTESSLLAGLPQAPSRFSPIYSPEKARERQTYVLQRMVEEKYIDQDAVNQIQKKPLKVFLREKYHEKAPYYMETLRQSLLQILSEELLLTGGLHIKAAIDLSLQEIARKQLKKGLRALDKRQGFRGPFTHLDSEKSIQEFFEKEENKMIEERRDFRLIKPPKNFLTGKTKNFEDSLEEKALKNIRAGEIFKGLVREINDEKKQVLVELPFGTVGIIPLENMKWARKPDPHVSFLFFSLKKPSLALKKGDVVFVKIEKKEDREKEEEREAVKKEATAQKTLFNITFTGTFFKNFIKKQKNQCSKESVSKKPDTNSLLSEEKKNGRKNMSCHLFPLSLEQEPLVEGALIAFDQKTGDILAMVGGYDFQRSQFNRSYQAARQTGSVFKPLVYLAALDKGFTPATLVTDTPVIYEEAEEKEEDFLKGPKKAETDDKDNQKTWKPDNYGRRFTGDILFRNAFIRSMNVPTVKIIENIGIQWVIDYARRLAVFSSLNPDYTLALGSSSVTLYEMTKVFSVFGRQGKRIRPLLLQEVSDSKHNILLNTLSLDERFSEQIQAWDDTMEKKRKVFLERKAKEKQMKEKKGLEDPDSGEKEEKEQQEGEELHSNEKEGALKDPSFFFSNPAQLISKKIAFIMTTLLRAVIRDPQGTGSRARTMDWPVAGKTGTTNGYYDAWFIGYSSQIVAGVWVGFDNEKSLGRGETGAKAALPIWLGFMQKAHTGKEKEEFKVPEGIVFTHIDNETGQLVSPGSRQVVRQAFIKGTQPLEAAEILKKTGNQWRRGGSEFFKRGLFSMKCIEIFGAKQNNLKSIDLKIPLGSFTVVCGPSGSGKSSLAFETLFAQGQRYYTQTLSNYARQYIQELPKPLVKNINNIPPSLALEQKNPVRSSRPTVATLTELADYFRLLFTHLGVVFCPEHREPVCSYSPAQGARKIQEIFTDHKGIISVPINPKAPGLSRSSLKKKLIRESFYRLWWRDKRRKQNFPVIRELSSSGRNLPEQEFYIVLDRLFF